MMYTVAAAITGRGSSNSASRMLKGFHDEDDVKPFTSAVIVVPEAHSTIVKANNVTTSTLEKIIMRILYY